MRKIVLCLIALALPGLAHAASTLDIGTQYRMRGITFTRPDFGQTADTDFAYYSQRALAHVGGRFSPNIEIMTQFQAIGVAGSSAPVTNLIANQAGSRYPNTNFSPWVQWAYMKASQIYDLPLDLTLGRQPMMLGDGFLISDDDLGLTGLRLQSRLPWYGLQADVFTFKAAEGFVNSADSDIFGAEFTKPTRAVRYQLSWLMERDASGLTTYVRPSENTANLTGSLVASRITRSFYDARVEGRLLEGGFYKGEFAMQQGHVNRDSGLKTANGVDVSNVDLSGYGFLVSAGLYTKTSKYGPIELHGLFGMGTGDSGDPGKDSSFRPTFAHRYDGLERSGFGEFYGASMFDALSSSGNPSGMPPGHSGIRIIGGGVTTHPTALLSVGIDYFVFNSLESNVPSYPNISPDSALGSEFDLGLGFAYTNYLNFRASFAFFSPGAAFANREQARRFLVEAIGRF